MPGQFVDTPRIYLREDRLQRGDWYADSQGDVLIIPSVAVGGEFATDFHGTLFDRVSELRHQIGETRNPTVREMKLLGFTLIPESQQYFSAQRGYYAE